MSLDGKIATRTGDSRMSSPEDFRRVHRLRASVDGIMVGLKTLLKDDPKLTVKFAKRHDPYRVVVDSSARTPLTSYVVRTAKQVPTIIATTSKAPVSKIEALRNRGAEVIVSGAGPRVSLTGLLNRLKGMGIRRLMLEGGGTLNWSMLDKGLVDEVSVAVSPIIIGGTDAVSLVEGKGTPLVKNGTKLKLLGVEKHGPDLVLRYKVLR
jgi:2,5-diamino-6-(ribosylamino)-4(3H)-pyrimidinone 5'-phosphate reductase